MAQVVERKVPPHLPPEQAHCLASGLIARYCSLPEAWLAGVGKEIRDLFGPGDAEWADLRANRAGRRCARQATSDAELGDCCTR